MASTTISFYRGDAPLIVVPITVAGAVPSGNASDYTAFFTLTSNAFPGSTDSDAAIEKSVTPVANASNWTASFQLENADTQGLDPTLPYYYDVQLVHIADSRPTTVISGSCIVKTDYTRRIA